MGYLSALNLVFKAMITTIEQYDEALATCKDIFAKKMTDYGAAWRILRPESITDQLFIKAKRIRTIQEVEQSKIEEDITAEFIGIVNYSAMGVLQLKKGASFNADESKEQIYNAYEAILDETKQLMLNKNHDYGEAWRDMRVESMTDLILMKVLRVKQIEDNKGETLISEGIDANYQDMINYALFCLILLKEANV